jgi:hypothetical protein
MVSLRRWLRETRLVRTALETPVDPAIFRRPPARVVLGLILLAGSYVLGWPAVAALAAAAGWLGRPELLVVGPVVYGVSWLIFGAAIILLGKDSISTGRALGLWLIRRMATKFLID